MRRTRSIPATRRRGAALVEFALVALALYLLLAAILGLGRWILVAQSAQDAARFAAREMALFPLPAGYDFGQALADPAFRGAVYDADRLVVDLGATPPGPALEAEFAGMPVVNRALRPLMITSDVDVGGTVRRLLHLPGALVDSPTSPTGLTVVVPRVLARDGATGAETIELAPVLEEVGNGSFSVASPDGGLVALRLNVPFQAATLSAYLQTDPAAPNRKVLADDGAVSAPGGAYRPIVGPGPDGTGPYSGTYGLGQLQALGPMGETVRPFRRLVAAQAMFRREVFQ